MKWAELKRRKEIIDHGRDSPFLPSDYYGTVIGHYWKQVIIDGRTTSILHPLIREEIVLLWFHTDVDHADITRETLLEVPVSGQCAFV